MTHSSLERRIIQAAQSLSDTGDTAWVSRGRERSMVLRLDSAREMEGWSSVAYDVRLSLVELGAGGHERSFFSATAISSTVSIGVEHATALILDQVRALFGDHAVVWSYATNPHDRVMAPAPSSDEEPG